MANIDNKKSFSKDELRKFGLVVGMIFGILFGVFFPWVFSKPWPQWPWWVCGPLVLLGLIAPIALKIPYRLWIGIGNILNWVNTRIILSVLFFGVFTPLGFLMRKIRKDPLRKSPDAKEKSYRFFVDCPLPNHMEKPY